MPVRTVAIRRLPSENRTEAIRRVALATTTSRAVPFTQPEVGSGMSQLTAGRAATPIRTFSNAVFGMISDPEVLTFFVSW